MEVARSVYRQPVIEAVLLLCVAFQGLSGLWLVVDRRRHRRGGVAWLQAASGSYLAVFLLVHVGAVLYGRSVLGLDTNFYYAAAGLHVRPFRNFFVPYYTMGVVALFAHLGCAVHWRVEAHRRTRRLVLPASLLSGVAVSALIVLSLGGKIQPFEIPARYLQTFARASGG
jgi:hypothetical protein